MATAPSPFLLLRHGQTTWNAEGRWQGWADAPLSALGEQQALDAAAHLRDRGFTRVCTSDLERARRTGELIAGELGLSPDAVVTDGGLRERNVGSFSGKTGEELRVEFADCFDPVTKRVLRVPDGESDDDLWARIEPVLVGLPDRFAGEKVLVIGHGGVIRTVERNLGIDPGASTPNLGGRWLSVVGGSLVAGDRFVPVDPELTTTPAAE